MNVQEATAKALLRRPRRAGRRPARRRRARRQRGADGRLQHRRPPAAARAARRAWASTPTRRRLPPLGLPASRSRPSASAARRPAGAPEPASAHPTNAGHETMTPAAVQRRSSAAQQPPRRRPAQHQLRRRQHLRQGHRRPTRSPAADVDLMWVKGSGGDLGTLTEAGLAVLRLDRLRALVDVYPGVEREDEMVAAFDYCLHGKGGAAPSIDTAMHGLVDAAHVDHLHPDAGIAIATAADGEALTKEIFGDRVVWVPWRRPGFQLGLDIAAVKRANPQAIGVILGGHGITAWGATQRGVRGATPWRSSAPPQAYIAERGTAGAVRRRASGLRAAARGRAPGPRRRAGPGAPRARLHRPAAGRPLHRHRRGARLPGPRRARARWPRSAPPARTTSCAPRSRPLVLDLPADAPLEDAVARLRELHAAYREDYRAYYERHADAGLARRCAAPTRRSCWCPASACSASARTSRPPGWPASSTSTRST